MSDTKLIRDLEAVAINVDISRENQTATLDLPIVKNGVFAVRISLPEFRRFHRHVAERLRKDPQLFDPVSRV